MRVVLNSSLRKICGIINEHLHYLNTLHFQKNSGEEWELTDMTVFSKYILHHPKNKGIRKGRDKISCNRKDY